MNRQQFEALEPLLGHTAIYKIFAMQSDYFISGYDVGVIYPIDAKFPPYLHSRICELVDSLSLYDRLKIADEETYLRLIPIGLGDNLYCDPNIKSTNEFCRKILAIRPDFIRFMPTRNIDTDTYLKYIQENGIPKYKAKLHPHLHNKEFLFYVWQFIPDILIDRKIYTPELLSEFLQLHPECEESHRIYDDEPVANILELIDRGELTRTTPIDMLTPDIVLRILETNPDFMLQPPYRSLVTQEMFDKYFMEQFEHFPKYTTREVVSCVYKKNRRVYFEYLEFYDEDIIYKELDKNPLSVMYISDPKLLHNLLHRDESLAHYIPPDMLVIVRSMNMKSARS